jgi:hypothetical protein
VFPRPAQSLALAPRALEAGQDALANAVALELRDGREDVELELPGWRGGVDALRQRHEGDAKRV